MSLCSSSNICVSTQVKPRCVQVNGRFSSWKRNKPRPGGSPYYKKIPHHARVSHTRVSWGRFSNMQKEGTLTTVAIHYVTVVCRAMIKFLHNHVLGEYVYLSRHVSEHRSLSLFACARNPNSRVRVAYHLHYPQRPSRHAVARS